MIASRRAGAAPAERLSQEVPADRLPHLRRQSEAVRVHALVVPVEHQRILGVGMRVECRPKPYDGTPFQRKNFASVPPVDIDGTTVLPGTMLAATRRSVSPSGVSNELSEPCWLAGA